MKDYELGMINQSPFYKQSHHDRYVRDSPKVKMTIRIPKTVHDDLTGYFKANGMNLSEGFNQMASDKLETINTHKRTCFNHIEMIMLIPKTSDIRVLNEKSQFISLYNTKTDFLPSFEYTDGFNKTPFNIRYELKDFCEDFFPVDNLLQIDGWSSIFGIHQKDLTDWNRFNQKLKELFEENGIDFDLDDAYFVRFPLNNYLDVNRLGQFQHPKHLGRHLGLYIFDEFGFRRLFFIMDWNYSGDKLMGFHPRFIGHGEFMRLLKDSPYKNLNNAYLDIKHSDYDKEEIKRLIEENERHGDFLKRLYDRM